jgi:hypothetical protein
VTAQQSLAQLALPPQIVPGGNPFCTSGADTRCGFSELEPDAVLPLLRPVVQGETVPEACAMLSSLRDGPCPLYGQVDDYPLVASVSPHLIYLKDGQRPPRGARPAHHNSTRTFERGTDVYISLLPPQE